jgi:Starch-binding associating with outer membrane
MKYNLLKKHNAAVLFLAATLIAGCAKIDQFGDTNQNPNGINQPITSALLTNVQASIGGLAANTRKVTYCQYVSESQYTDVSLYSLPQIEMGPSYAGAAAASSANLNDLQIIINYNSDPKTAGIAEAYGSNANQIAIAKILKAYIFWVLTDNWGDIPYSEALLGAVNSSPKYDKQEDIYFGLMKDIKEAVAGFNNGKTVAGDIIYAGDVAKWKKMGNSLRMLMAMRLTKKYPAAGGKAALEFADAYGNAAGYITTNADNFSVKYPGGSFKNPWYLTYEARDDYATSKTMYDVLGGLGDTRQSVFGTSTIGFPYGLSRDLAVSFTTSTGNNHARVLALSKRTETSAVVIMGAANVLLAKAEAIERTWIAGGSADAQIAYEAGITASFGEWGLAVPAGYLAGPANYVSGNGVSTNVGGATAPYDNFRAAESNIQNAITATKIDRIALQRWVASFPNGHEGWCEWRRTGVPALKKTRFATGEMVRRYVYGVQDYSLNSDKTKEAAARLTGGDKQESKVWWDQ